MSSPVILIGSGGHAKVLVDILRLLDREIIGYVDLEPPSDSFCGLRYLGNDQDIKNWSPLNVKLVNGIGIMPKSHNRYRIFQYFKSQGYEFERIIHPSSIISPNSRLLEGVQVMAGSIIQTDTTIGENTIVNTRVSVDHDCLIGAHVHLAPGATISGGTTIEDHVFVGAGAVVVQSQHIGMNSLIGAGAVVLKKVKENSMVVGIPAKEV